MHCSYAPSLTYVQYVNMKWGMGLSLRKHIFHEASEDSTMIYEKDSVVIKIGGVSV